MVHDRVYHVQILIGLMSHVLVCFLLAAPNARADGTLPFDVLYDTDFPGCAVHAVSESLIHPAGDRLYPSRAFRIPAEVRNAAVAGFICVTGESARMSTDSVAAFSVPVRRAAGYQMRMLETLYHEIFTFAPTGETEVVVSKVLSDVVNPAGKFKYSTAAATVIVVYRKSAGTTKRIRIFTGLSAPIPGEVYGFSFDRAAPQHRPLSIRIAGGHGIKGNATGNLLNGTTLSGGDDWDGSTGPLWDFDRYDLKAWNFDGIMDYKLAIDTILNWIYPELVIFEEEVKM